MTQQIQKYKDLPFFMSENPFTGDINTVNGMAAIRQSIKNIVMTNNGERGFNYSFGGNLYTSLFENFQLEMILDIQSKISTNLVSYENRIALNDVRVLDYPEENAISVVIDFYVPELNKNDIIVINLTRNR